MAAAGNDPGHFQDQIAEASLGFQHLPNEIKKERGPLFLPRQSFLLSRPQSIPRAINSMGRVLRQTLLFFFAQYPSSLYFAPTEQMHFQAA